MLKKTLILGTFIICSFMGLQAMNQEILPIEMPKEVQEQKFVTEEEQKDVTPGLFICNCDEEECIKEGNQEEESSVSSLFSCEEDEKEEAPLLACRDCL